MYNINLEDNKNRNIAWNIKVVGTIWYISCFTGLANLNYLSFLFSCVGVQEYQATDIEIYHCPNCQLAHGPLVCKFYVIAWHCNGIEKNMS